MILKTLFEIIKSKEGKKTKAIKKSKENLRGIWNVIHMHIMRIPEREERRKRGLFEEKND